MVSFSLKPLPDFVVGVTSPLLSLDGTWRFCAGAAGDAEIWEEVTVPGEVAMQGFPIEQDKEYRYEKSLSIPAEFAGQQIVLRFDGVYSYARVWVNGLFAGEHLGGFTAWDCDITASVRPGSLATITVGVTDRHDDISLASGYAFHPIGGILRSVYLIAFPPTSLARLHIQTQLTADLAQAVLEVTCALDRQQAPVQLHVALQDPWGATVALANPTVVLAPRQHEITRQFSLAAPLTWDAEHPRLYALTMTVECDGKVVERVVKQIGFRQVEVRGNQLIINGRPVKLRGINRHDIHPTLGRTCPDDLAVQDVVLFKNANINFIRTSHYPPSEAFLDACDRLGMYVEEETAVCWSGINPENTSGSDPAYQEWYVGQLAEMIERDRNHACVILWSLGNESKYARNFAEEYQYIKRTDRTRPVIFSFATSQISQGAQYDIFSSHYPAWTDPLGSPDFPVLHDEYAHVACYNIGELERDPNVRNFWGESIKQFWEMLFVTDGALGGAIWAGIDEIFHLPGKGLVGYGEWGIVDVWRREKPEYWLVKKAYSPIQIQELPLIHPGAEQPLHIPLVNRFDHTNLAEITLRWQVGEEVGNLTGPDIAPHAAGVLTLPARHWRQGEQVELVFTDRQGRQLDAYALQVGRQDRGFLPVTGPAPSFTEDEHVYVITGGLLHLRVNKQSGLIEQGVYGDQLLIKSGPYLRLDDYCLPAAWSLLKLSVRQENAEIVLDIAGSYGRVDVTFTLRLDGRGLLRTFYRLDELRLSLPASRTDAGAMGFDEVGIAYEIPEALDLISWQRRGLWSVYPSDHPGRTRGSARASSETAPAFPTDPATSWSQETRNEMCERFKSSSRSLTNDFSSLKEYVRTFSVQSHAHPQRLCVESLNTVAARIAEAETFLTLDSQDPTISYHGDWHVAGDLEGWSKAEYVSRKAGDSATVRFWGTRIRWFGSRSKSGGLAHLFLDDLFVATIDLYSENKCWNQILYEKEGLTCAYHTLTITVSGERNPSAQDDAIALDRFDISDAYTPGFRQLVVLNQWNYRALGWGNRVKPPVSLGKGSTGVLNIRFTDREEDEGGTPYQ